MLIQSLGQPDQMTMGQVHQIAENADQLIQIINNIKNVSVQFLCIISCL